MDTTCSIHLLVTELEKASGYNYTYLVCRGVDGEDKVILLGLSLKRRSSETRALRGVMAPPLEAACITSVVNFVAEYCLFRGGTKEYLRRVAAASKALHFINSQNLSHRSYSRFSDSPNSIASTLVVAMGLEYPEAATHFWIPGYERVLLPRNWQSFNFYDLEICVPSFAYQVGVPENTEEYRVVDSSFDKLNQELKDFQFDGLASNTLKLVTGIEIDLL